MDDPVRSEEPKASEEKKAGTVETDRRTLLRTAGLAGAAGAALAGAMHGKFSLAPISEAQATDVKCPVCGGHHVDRTYSHVYAVTSKKS